MRYFLDTEFIERPCTIDLVSIGIVSERDDEFYAENAHADLARGDAWFHEHVAPHLLHGAYALPHEQIGPLVLAFIADDPAPEFWAYYADYDWVAFCWLFGRMIDLPDHFPKFCRDIKQLAVELGDPPLPEQESAEHHALADARWNRVAWEALTGSLDRDYPERQNEG